LRSAKSRNFAALVQKTMAGDSRGKGGYLGEGEIHGGGGKRG